MTVLKTKKSEITFMCDSAPKAKSVYLVGDFNHWDPNAKKMAKLKDGSFKAKLTLSPGQHQYKFIADGIWIEDKKAQKRVLNEFGTFNSVVEV